MDIQHILNVSKHFIKKNSPTILTGMAIAGVVTVAVSAVKDTHVADRKIKIAKISNGRELSKTETVKTVLPCYIPTGLSVVATLACIGGALKTGNAKTAAYASAYTMAQEAAKNYRTQVERILSEKDIEKLNNAVADDAMAKSDAKPIVVGSGKVLCFDQFSGRYFESDMQSLREIQNDLNEQLLTDMWVSVNEYYDKLKLEPINAGEELGWNPDYKVKLQYSSRLSEDGRPCLVVSFDTSPSADFYRKY